MTSVFPGSGYCQQCLLLTGDLQAATHVGAGSQRGNFQLPFQSLESIPTRKNIVDEGS